MLYLESLRLRTRDLPSLKFFKDVLEDKLALKTEDGAGAFSVAVRLTANTPNTLEAFATGHGGDGLTSAPTLIR